MIAPLLATGLALFAGTSWAAGGLEPAGKAGTMRPEAIYRNYCSVCHGDRGDGRSRARTSLVPPPRDFTDSRIRGELTREAMIVITREGKPGTAMVGWKTQLRDAEIEAVVDYIRSSFMRAAPAGIPGAPATAVRQPQPAVRADMSLPLPKGLAGNAERGGRFYQANCATCHGAQGDGQGPRAYFIKPRPRNFLDTQARATFNRPALFAAIAMGKPGTEMPAWGKVLDDQQMADVVEYVFRQFVQPAGLRSGGRDR
ncbi:MAG: c-type cytochrome [Betaproteobacteria bacterium]|nr:c-type cytochrome [Betaproteobacteria bacterium]